MPDDTNTLGTQGSAPEAAQTAPQVQSEPQAPQQSDVFSLTQRNEAAPPEGSGKAIPPWVNQFKGPLQKNEVFHRYATLSDFGNAYLERDKQYQELEARMKDAFFFPGEGATEEEVNGFLSRLGRPGKPEEYDLKLGEEFGNFEIDPEDQKELAVQFHRAGLSKGQARHVFESIVRRSVARMQSNTQASKASEENLKKSWGQDYDKNLELSKRAMQKYFPDLKALDERGLGNDPLIMEMFHRIGKELGEDRLIFGNSSGKPKGRGLADLYNMED